MMALPLKAMAPTSASIRPGQAGEGLEVGAWIVRMMERKRGQVDLPPTGVPPHWRKSGVARCCTPTAAGLAAVPAADPYRTLVWLVCGSKLDRRAAHGNHHHAVRFTQHFIVEVDANNGIGAQFAGLLT